MAAIDFSSGYFPHRADGVPAKTSLAANDPQLTAVLSKPDDRLLEDAGLSRDELLGPEGTWRREREALARIWTL